MLKIKELWSLRIKPSDLYNIERIPADKPENGGGHTYIQIPKRRVDDTLEFLRSSYPPNGKPIKVQVLDVKKAIDKQDAFELEFSSKSSGRMRINRQNRNSQSRLPAWDASRGFPKLEPYEGSDVADELLKSIGHAHIFLIRDDYKNLWAGFTKGTPSSAESKQPFSDILWGENDGGLWKS